MVIGTTAQALGANLQRLSASREAVRDAIRRRPARRQPMFIVGVVLLVGAGTVSSLALIFAAQAVLAPLILLLFIANPIFAHVLNGESFDWRTDGICTLLIISSVALVVSYAPHHTQDFSVEHMRFLLSQPTFFSFVVVLIVFLTASYAGMQRIYQRVHHDWAHLVERPLWERSAVHIAFGSLGGTFGGLNVTLTKATFTVIIAEFDRGRESGGVVGGLSGLFTSWLAYL